MWSAGLMPRRHKVALGVTAVSLSVRDVQTPFGMMMAWLPRRAGKLAPNEVALRVTAVGLNFRDVLNVLGMYPGDPGDPGGDCAGIVTAAGSAAIHKCAAFQDVLHPRHARLCRGCILGPKRPRRGLHRQGHDLQGLPPFAGAHQLFSAGVSKGCLGSPCENDAPAVSHTAFLQMLQFVETAPQHH